MDEKPIEIGEWKKRNDRFGVKASRLAVVIVVM